MHPISNPAQRWPTPVLLGLLSVLLIVGCQQGNSRGEYVTQAAVSRTLEQKVVANGTVNPLETVQVGAQVSGLITEILVDFNSPVRRGQVIARIDPTIYAAKVAQARSALTSAQAEMEKAKTNLELARTQLRRYETLASQKLIPQMDLDNQRAVAAAAQADFQAAQARLAQIKAQFDEASANLRYTTITSPVDGIVISRNVEVGRTVVATLQTPTLFTIAQDLTQMQVAAEVDGSEVGNVKVGQPVTFTVDAYRDKVFSGQIDQVRLAPNITQNVVTYTILIRTANPELLLKPGMIATVTVLAASRPQVLAVPSAALRFQPQEIKLEAAADSPSVWRLAADGRPQQVPVTVGISDGLWTEIKAGALQAGDLVIIEQKGNAKGAGLGLRRLFY
jgi:HlyD family secretion protein